MDVQRRPTLRQLADARGISVGVMLDLAVREHGTLEAAARALGVQPNTVYQWVQRNDYRVVQHSTLVRKEAAS